jgi:hypothetical protein
VIAATLALMAAAAWWPAGAGRLMRERVLLVLVLAAVVFPLLYETANPERYYTLAVLVPLISAIHLRRCGFGLGRRRGAQPGVAAGFLGLLAVAGRGVAGARDGGELDDEHVYNRYGCDAARAP